MADPGFPKEGRQNKRGIKLLFVTFCKKLHENVGNWTEGAPSAPLDPPLNRFPEIEF